MAGVLCTSAMVLVRRIQGLAFEEQARVAGFCATPSCLAPALEQGRMLQPCSDVLHQIVRSASFKTSLSPLASRPPFSGQGASPFLVFASPTGKPSLFCSRGAKSLSL